MANGTIPPQAVQIRCQNCQTPFTAPVWSYIDVGVQPELKAGLLSGQVNMAICPKCGLGGMLATPMAYHDPAKKLFFVLIPQELNLRQDEQERFVGEVSRVAMTTLPDNAPKGYLLTPRQFFSLQSMMESVMEAEGISKEVLQAQQARVALLSELADAFEADKADPPADDASSKLAEVVNRHQAALDYEFFLTLSAYVEAAAQQGRAESATILAELRERLVELTGFDAVEAGLAPADPRTMIEEFLAAEDDQLPDVVAQHRPAIDDDFWDAWDAYTAELAGDQSQSQARREAAYALVEQMDQEAQAMFEAATSLLRTVLEAADPKAVLQDHRAQLNEAFMLVIEANVAAALRSGQEPIAEKLINIRHLAVEVIEESMTPQDRLINQLLNAETSADAKKILRKNMGQVNQELIQQLNTMVEQMEKGGQQEAATRLREMSREAASLLF